MKITLMSTNETRPNPRRLTKLSLLNSPRVVNGELGGLIQFSPLSPLRVGKMIVPSRG